MTVKRRILTSTWLHVALFALALASPLSLVAQHDDSHGNGHETHAQEHDHDAAHADADHAGHGDEAHAAGHEMSYTERVMHHISDANEFHLWGDVHIPLPCILWSKEDGLQVFMSSAFEHGHKAVGGYVLNHGDVMRLADADARATVQHVSHFGSIEQDGHVAYAAYGEDGTAHLLEKPSTVLAFSSWIDFSISKNVFTMLLAMLIFFLIFSAVKSGYKKNAGKAPKGLQSLLEPIILFLRDEVVKPTIGHHYERYFPFVLSMFFFILINNLLGLIPIFPGSANVTGNVSVTMGLALFTFVIVLFSANRAYWEHIFWMPGVPIPVRFLLAPIEFLGLFIRPFTLFIRLFANISAGHIIILSLIGLIFILGKNGESLGGAVGGAVVAVPFVFVMNLLELFVAFLQAFIFALLSSLYIGMAIEEHDHH